MPQVIPAVAAAAAGAAAPASWAAWEVVALQFATPATHAIYIKSRDGRIAFLR